MFFKSKTTNSLIKREEQGWITVPKTIEGIYRDGKIELLETPDGVCEGTRAVVVFLSPGAIGIEEHGIDKLQAADLRARFSTFVEDWESPEMSVYDNYDAEKVKLQTR